VRAVNLIPADQRGGGGPAIGVSDGPAFMVIGLLAGLAVLALLYGMASHQIVSRKAQVASTDEQAQAIQARASELAPYVSFKQMYQQRLQDVSQLVGTRFDWAHAFHELGRVLPSDASLTAVHGTIGSSTGSNSTSSSSSSASGGAVASATPAGSVPTFTLGGCATSQSEVAQTLQRLRLIDGVSAVTLQSSAKGSGSGGSNGACPPGDPAFAMTVTFAGLPTPPAIPTATAGTANASDTGASSGSSTAAATPTAGVSGSGATAGSEGKGAQ
jgi:Tfp pilus assembly protein PilN